MNTYTMIVIAACACFTFFMLLLSSSIAAASMSMPKPTQSGSSTSSATASDFMDPPSGGTWCRVSGSTAYSGYLSDANTDVNTCKSKCKADTKCKAFEYNGSNCWYYGGAESAQTTGLPAGSPNKCYVKV